MRAFRRSWGCYCDVVSSSGEESHEDLGRLFSGFAEPVPEVLDSIAERDLHRATIEEVALDSWVRGRVLLVGDAAHATSPNMAEGAAMALEDALVLAECLARLEAIPAALSAFEARRRPRTDPVATEPSDARSLRGESVRRAPGGGRRAQEAACG
jgi:2-polyprenyl-6-methoxyphenol hydroxylase-like FAD-dependent oxidoreductase